VYVNTHVRNRYLHTATSNIQCTIHIILAVSARTRSIHNSLKLLCQPTLSASMRGSRNHILLLLDVTTHDMYTVTSYHFILFFLSSLTFASSSLEAISLLDFCTEPNSVCISSARLITASACACCACDSIAP